MHCGALRSTAQSTAAVSWSVGEVSLLPKMLTDSEHVLSMMTTSWVPRHHAKVFGIPSKVSLKAELAHAEQASASKDAAVRTISSSLYRQLLQLYNLHSSAPAGGAPLLRGGAVGRVIRDGRTSVSFRTRSANDCSARSTADLISYWTPDSLLLNSSLALALLSPEFESAMSLVVYGNPISTCTIPVLLTAAEGKLHIR